MAGVAISYFWARLSFVIVMDLYFFCKRKPKDQASFQEVEFYGVLDKSRL